MKRSEMVTKLVGFVFDATDGTTTISEEEANLLLLFVEQTGIYPPAITVLAKVVMLDDEGNIVFDDEGNIVYDETVARRHIWEQE